MCWPRQAHPRSTCKEARLVLLVPAHGKQVCATAAHATQAQYEGYSKHVPAPTFWFDASWLARLAFSLPVLTEDQVQGPQALAGSPGREGRSQEVQAPVRDVSDHMSDDKAPDQGAWHLS